MRERISKMVVTHIYIMAFPRELSFTLNERATTASFGLNCIQYHVSTKKKRGDGRPHHLFSKVFNQTLADKFFVPSLVSTTPGRDLFSSLPSSPPPPLKGTISGKSRRDVPLLSRHLVTRLQRYHPRGGKHPKGEEIFAITIAVGGNERWLKCIFGKIG